MTTKQYLHLFTLVLLMTCVTGCETIQESLNLRRPTAKLSGIKFEEVRLLDLEADRVMHQELVFKNYGRVRDVGIDPEGMVYVVVNKPDRIIRLTPLAERTGQ